MGAPPGRIRGPYSLLAGPEVMTAPSATGPAGCHRLRPDLFLAPSRPKLDKAARMRNLLGVIRALGAIALVVVASTASWAQKGPIKAGLILPETDPLAANGKDMANGMQLFFEEQGRRRAATSRTRTSSWQPAAAWTSPTLRADPSASTTTAIRSRTSTCGRSSAWVASSRTPCSSPCPPSRSSGPTSPRTTSRTPSPHTTTRRAPNASPPHPTLSPFGGEGFRISLSSQGRGFPIPPLPHRGRG